MGNIKMLLFKKKNSILIIFSFKGYLALDTRKSKHEFIKDNRRWHELLHNDRFVIQNEYFDEDAHTIQATYTETEELHAGNYKTNVILAAFVTCYGRLELYKALEKLGDRSLYFDTDSVYYISRPGAYDLPRGDYLGMFTNELAPGKWIVEFGSTGPKSLGFEENDGQTHCTLKGITYNYLASCKLDFEQIKDIVFNNDHDITVPQLKFIRTKNTYEVYTTVQEKNFRYTYDKRIVMPDFTTRPYGFFHC
jgi:hypothetical protein